MSEPKTWQYRIEFVNIPETLEPEEIEYNLHLATELQRFGDDGWECYQVLSMRYGAQVRVYLKKEIT